MIRNDQDQIRPIPTKLFLFLHSTQPGKKCKNSTPFTKPKNLATVRGMKPEHVLKIVAFCDKCEFWKGIEICDEELIDFFNGSYECACGDGSTPPLQLDSLVEAVSAAHKHQLKRSLRIARNLIVLSFLWTRHTKWSNNVLGRPCQGPPAIDHLLLLVLLLASPHGCDPRGTPIGFFQVLCLAHVQQILCRDNDFFCTEWHQNNCEWCLRHTFTR